MIDLHMHSKCSDDGEFSPTELVRQCKEAGITVMSITDHNTVRGNEEAKQAANELQIQYVPAIEIDCTIEGVDMHLLGYRINDESPDFEQIDRNVMTQEKDASRKRLKLTNQLGFELSEAELSEVASLDEYTSVWTGEIFAELLLAKEEYKDNELLLPYREGGARADNPYVNFYWDYYSQGKPCYAKINFPSLADAISIIKDNGGKAVFAHPGIIIKNNFELFDKAVSLGIDGVEVFCSYHDTETAKFYYELALKNSLLATCGSDYHGKNKPAVKLGGSGCWLSMDEMKAQLSSILS